MGIITFDRSHFYEIFPQIAQANVPGYITDETWANLPKDTSFSYEHGGERLAVGGWIEITPYRALLWAYLHKDIKHKLTFVHKEACCTIACLPYRRLELEVDRTFEQGHRWAKLLGFEVETERARYYRPDGKDATIYVRYKDG